MLSRAIVLMKVGVVMACLGMVVLWPEWRVELAENGDYEIDSETQVSIAEDCMRFCLDQIRTCPPCSPGYVFRPFCGLSRGRIPICQFECRCILDVPLALEE
jgi:hypothetical protein